VVPLSDPGRIAALAKDLQLKGPVTLMSELPGPDRYVVLVRGILERLRMSGGITHHWLENWLDPPEMPETNVVWLITQRRPVRRCRDVQASCAHEACGDPRPRGRRKVHPCPPVR
jgi:hypothetical protein